MITPRRSLSAPRHYGRIAPLPISGAVYPLATRNDSLRRLFGAMRMLRCAGVYV